MKKITTFYNYPTTPKLTQDFGLRGDQSPMNSIFGQQADNSEIQRAPGIRR